MVGTLQFRSLVITLNWNKRMISPEEMKKYLGNQKKIKEKIEDKDCLFHYTSAEIAINHILFEKSLKFTPLKNMSDPFENKNFEFYYKNVDLKKYNIISEKENELQKIKEHSKIACFCSNRIPEIGYLDTHRNRLDKNIIKQDSIKEIPAYKRSRMWNQYADNHKGVCIVFSKDKLIETTEKQFGLPPYKEYVVYSKDYYYFRFNLDLDCNELVCKNSEEFIKKYLENKKNYIYFSKYIDYRDEAEFRIVIYDPADNKDFFLKIGNCILGVIIGENCPDGYGSYINELCRKLNIFCSTIEWRHGIPEIWPIN